MKNLLATSLLAAGLLTAAAAADAQIYVNVRPPRPVYERRPIAPRPGYAWQGGYHRWDGARYVWVPGTYVAQSRPGAVWVPGRWVNSRRGWQWREGHWR